MALNLNPLLSFTFLQMGYHSSPKFSMASMHRSVSREIKNTKKTSSSPLKVQVTHSMPPHKIEIFKSMENWVEENVLIHLKPVEKCWQPQDFLPDPASDGFHERVKELQERAKGTPDDYFVVLVGHMITEEALPTYQTFSNFDNKFILTNGHMQLFIPNQTEHFISFPQFIPQRGWLSPFSQSS
ncbi:hypothetical protein VitviT2T_007594 [Vitis vinifera]|uniref:Stearoyl-[acyl-carrier-protein] 9-desaturase, chloroplastic n=2 Tax=Vitis vinifera TaxID=29760 RepID=A0ABY9C009_VITVI|nr:hypothetical protein VitviT2T_007594 [Vitis vinifera]